MPTETKPLAELTTFEKFQRYQDRQPISEELEAMRDGLSDADLPHPMEGTREDTKESTSQPPAWREARPGLLDWTPSRKQLVALAETIGSEGWAVFLDLMKKRLEVLRETAITVSQNDPLAQPDVVAREWAYHSQYKRVIAEMEPLMREQLDQLKKAEE